MVTEIAHIRVRPARKRRSNRRSRRLSRCSGPLRAVTGSGWCAAARSPRSTGCSWRGRQSTTP